MKCPNARDYRAWMFDAQCQEITGNVAAVPAGTRLDKRVSRPKEKFYTTLRTSEAPERGRKVYEEREPFLARNTRDRMPVPSASNAERPKHKKYR